MNIGDVWGASSQPRQRKEPLPMGIKESALLIHHKIVALHDEHDNGVTEIDNNGLHYTTGMTAAAWRSIINLDIDYFERRPVNAARMMEVAHILLGLTCEDWLELSKTRTKMLPDSAEAEHEYF